MESTLEEVEFLVRSPNRVDVLRLLAEDHQTRNELAAETDASQATLGRILTDFQERSWVRQLGAEYVATGTGRLVASGISDLLQIIETERELRGIVEYLPTHAMDFDLRHLADATIVTPSQTRPDAPVSRVVDLLGVGSDVTVFSHAFNHQSLAAVHERVTTGEQTFRGVFSEDAVEALADDATLTGYLVDLLDAEDAALRVRTEDIPIAVTTVDDVVHVILRDDSGVLQASLDTDDDAVRSWARDTFDHYWRTADPLKRADLDSR